MIDHVWSVLCRKAVIDRESNVITLVEALEQLNVIAGPVIQVSPAGVTRPAPPQVRDVLPAIPVEAEVVTLWTRRVPDEASSGLARLVWKAPGAKRRNLGRPFDVDLSGQFNRLRTRVHLGGLPARQSGRYYIVVQYQQQGATRWSDVATLPLDINLVVEEEGSQASG